MTHLEMPANRFAWYNFTFPTRKAAIDAIYEIGKCQIGLLAMTVPPWFVSMAKARATGTDKPTGAAGLSVVAFTTLEKVTSVVVEAMVL